VVVRSRTIVWSSGVRPTDPLGGSDEPRIRSKRLAVDANLRLPGYDNVFVIGDAASVHDRGGELPMRSPPAMQAGRHAARSILDAASGREDRPPFRYVEKGTMATIGRRAAVADVRGWLLASWAWDYIRRDRPIRLILRSEADPLAEEVDSEEPPH